MKFQNIMEDLVAEKLDEVIDELDCCKCEQCRGDILSYTLNRLSPKYASTQQGRAFAKLDTMSSQFEIDLLTALYEAASKVRQHPRHSDSQP